MAQVGSINHKAKLNEEIVKEIKRTLSSKSNEQIAREFGTSRKTVWRIRRGEGWKHVN